jgi:hypothetical protein
VHGSRGIGIGGVDQAEDLAVLLVDPVAQVVNAVCLLGLQVGACAFATSSMLTGPSRVSAGSLVDIGDVQSGTRIIQELPHAGHAERRKLRFQSQPALRDMRMASMRFRAPTLLIALDR